MKPEDFLNSHGYSPEAQKQGYVLSFEEMVELLEKYRKEMHWPAPRKKVCSACELIAKGYKGKRTLIHTCKTNL